MNHSGRKSKRKRSLPPPSPGLSVPRKISRGPLSPFLVLGRNDHCSSLGNQQEEGGESDSGPDLDLEFDDDTEEIQQEAPESIVTAPSSSQNLNPPSTSTSFRSRPAFTNDDVQFLETIPADPRPTLLRSQTATEEKSIHAAQEDTPSPQDCELRQGVTGAQRTTSGAKHTKAAKEDPEIICELVRVHECLQSYSQSQEQAPCCYKMLAARSSNNVDTSEVSILGVFEGKVLESKSQTSNFGENKSDNIFAKFGIRRLSQKGGNEGESGENGDSLLLDGGSSENQGSARSAQGWKLEDLENLKLDLSQGQEGRAIPAVNEVNPEEEPLPPYFQYVTDLVPGPSLALLKAQTDGCDCEGGCSNKGCICFFQQESMLNGKCAYNKNLLRIWECTRGCGCEESCQNRVAQKGLRTKLEVFRTAETGWGVRAAEPIPKRTFVAQYAGEMLHGGEEVQKRSETQGDEYIFEMDYDSRHSVDAKFKGNVTRFVNHSCRPNLQSMSVLWGGEKPGVNRVALFTTKDIKPGDELTLDYTERYWYPKGKDGIFCKCGARYCRFSRENFPKFQAEYKQRKKTVMRKANEEYQKQLDYALKMSMKDADEAGPSGSAK